MPFFLRVLLSACLLLSAPTGAAAGGEPVRDIRKVVVGGDGSASATVLKRTGERLRAAARATRRPVELERAVMEVRISGVTHGADGRNSAKVAITLSGGRKATRRFTVNSFMPAPKGRDAALAEAIAARVALAYRLAPAKAVAAQGKRPGKGRKHAGRVAPRVSSHAYPGRDGRPLVIPSEAALTVRSRALPAGSRSKVAPCVVTRTVSCD